MNHRILTTLVMGSLIFISSCTVNIVQAPVSSDAETFQVSDRESTSPSPAVPSSSSDPEFLEDIDTTQDSSLLCEPFEFPELDEVPKFPYVPPERRSDDEFVAAMLIEHLDRLTAFIEHTDSTIRTKYREYLNECD